MYAARIAEECLSTRAAELAAVERSLAQEQADSVKRETADRLVAQTCAREAELAIASGVSWSLNDGEVFGRSQVRKLEEAFWRSRLFECSATVRFCSNVDGSTYENTVAAGGCEHSARRELPAGVSQHIVRRTQGDEPAQPSAVLPVCAAFALQRTKEHAQARSAGAKLSLLSVFREARGRLRPKTSERVKTRVVIQKHRST